MLDAGFLHVGLSPSRWMKNIIRVFGTTFSSSVWVKIFWFTHSTVSLSIAELSVRVAVSRTLVLKPHVVKCLASSSASWSFIFSHPLLAMESGVIFTTAVSVARVTVASVTWGCQIQHAKFSLGLILTLKARRVSNIRPHTQLIRP
jgi:hypothetical protein